MPWRSIGPPHELGRHATTILRALIKGPLQGAPSGGPLDFSKNELGPGFTWQHGKSHDQLKFLVYTPPPKTNPAKPTLGCVHTSAKLAWKGQTRDGVKNTQREGGPSILPCCGRLQSPDPPQNVWTWHVPPHRRTWCSFIGGAKGILFLTYYFLSS